MPAMVIDRRAFLAGASLAAFAPRALEASFGTDVFAAACAEADGSFAAVVSDAAGGIVTRVPLPARGHDIALRPGGNEGVVFARRPGRFAVAFAADGSRAPVSFEAAPGRHFFGHGVFSPDGRLLISTEDDIEAAHGVLGLRDATNGYRLIGEFSSGGVGPHDLCLLADGRTLVVANSGMETGGGREPLNLDVMEPSLAYVDLAAGDLLERHVLPPDLHKLSIRHLAIGAGGTVVFACQHQGPAGEHPPLIGFHRRGEPMRMMEAPEMFYQPLQNYVGSVAADASGEVAAATSPRGGMAVLIDIAKGRAIGARRLADVCGVAPRHAGAGFLLTTGFGQIARWIAPGDELEVLRRAPMAWDNHAVLVSAI